MVCGVSDCDWHLQPRTWRMGFLHLFKLHPCLGPGGGSARTLLTVQHVDADWQCLCRQLDSARHQLSLQAQQQEQQAARNSDEAAALQQQVSLWQRRAEHMRERAAEERSK